MRKLGLSLSVLTCAATAWLAVPVVAQPQATTTITVTGSTPERRVCRDVRLTGSRFTTRTCRTQTDDKNDRESQQDAARELQLYENGWPTEGGESIGPPRTVSTGPKS